MNQFKIPKQLLRLYKETRPWGKFEKFVENEKCTIKILYLNPYSKTSLQMHKNRDEFWKVLEGSAQVELEENIFFAGKGDTVQIHKNLKHRASTDAKSCVIMEISIGHFDENDIIRFEDEYNRL
jgi:mannose-6-phosphate isomerase-like protein (cupin superfamily)